MRKYFRSVLTVVGLGLFFFFASSLLKAQDRPDILNLQIPQFAITNATMEEAVTKLLAWGIQVGLEKAPVSEEQQETKISLDLQSVSVRDILDHLVDSDSRYEWERYARDFRPTRFINVFPSGAKKDGNNLMNIKTEETVTEGEGSPEEAIQYVRFWVSELSNRIYRSQLGAGQVGGIAGSRSRVIGGPVELKADFVFRDLTVREILNEIALRTDGKGWVYEFDKSQQHPWSQHRWDVLWPAVN